MMTDLDRLIRVAYVPILPVLFDRTIVTSSELKAMRLPATAGWPGYLHLPSNKVFPTYKLARKYHHDSSESSHC